MLEWLLKTIGIGDEFIKHIDHVTVSVQHPLLLAFGLVLLVPVSVFIFWWQKQNLVTAPPGLRITLSLTRIFVLFLLVLVLADPHLKLEERTEKKPIVAVLFDYSQSMQLPTGEFESETELIRTAKAAGYQTTDGQLSSETRKALPQMPRIKLAQTAVQTSAKALIEPLAKKFDVQFYSFARDLTPLPVDAKEPKLPEAPRPGGPASHIGDAVHHVLSEAGGRQVAGILLFSDGQNTGGRSIPDAGQAAGAAGAPIFAVPTGGSARLRDVSIVDVSTSGQVAVGDTARVIVDIESQGFDKRPVKVLLKDGDQVLDTKDLVLDGREQQRVELAFQAKTPGARYLTVHVPPLPEEPEYLHGNNTDVAFVRVSEEKVRVLYVEGMPRWDYRFLKNEMGRDHGLAGRTANEPDRILEAELRRRPPGEQAYALPRTIEALAEYHTIILGDVSPKVLTPEFIALLDKAVREKGVGLIVEAGPLSMPHGFDKKFLELLPVQLKPKVAGFHSSVATKPFRLELTPDGGVHEAMRLHADPGSNAGLWSQMQPYYWCAAVERAAPAATVMAWNPNIQNSYGKLPLISYHHSGQGKVMFVGTDSTWLWRQHVGDRFFYRFWGQSIRFVARRDQANAKKSWIEVRPVRAQPGEQAQIELMAFAADGTPRTEPKLMIQVAGGSTASGLELTADPSLKGRYTGRQVLTATGDYRFTYTPDGAAPVEGRVRVLTAPEELRHPSVNRPAMLQLAGTSNGKLVELHELATIAEQIKGDSKFSTLRREATLWDNWLLLAVLMFVYSLDVGLRRLVGLS